MSRSNYWCFTINNYNENEVSTLSFLVPTKIATYITFGYETGENGTRHIQGYVELPKRLRTGQVVSLLGGRAHVERRLGTAEQASEYCQKDGIFFEHGTISVPQQGKRTDLESLHQSLQANKSLKLISNEHFGSYIKYAKNITSYRLLHTPNRVFPPSVIVYWGRTGAGKTRAVHDNITTDDLWIYPGNGWFDGYDAHPVVLFDDFSGSEVKISYLLKLLDRYDFRVPVKGGFVKWVPQEIYITSNLDPDSWYPNAHLEHNRALKRRFTNLVHFE